MRTIITFIMLAFAACMVNAQEINQQERTLISNQVRVSERFLAEQAKAMKVNTNDPDAGENLMNETFETFPPEGWSLNPSSVITDYADYENYWVGTTEAWITRSGVSIEPIYDSSNVNYAVFDAYWTGQGEQSLVTPALRPSTESYVLEFALVQVVVNPQYLAEGIKMYIEISTNDGSTWTNSTENAMEYIETYNTHSGSEYIEMDGIYLTLNLSGYIGQNIKVRFRAISDFGGAWAAIDNVTGVPFATGGDDEVDPITTYPWTESFGGQNPLAQWTVIDADGDGYAWMITDDGSGSNKAAGSFSWYNYTLYPDDYLISPLFSLKEDARYTLSYDAGSVISEFMPFYLETYSVMISTNGLNLESFEPIYTETLPDAEFRKLEFSLDEYAGKDIYIAFRHHDSSDEYILLVDNVKIDELTDTMAIDIVPDNTIRLFPNPATDYMKLTGLQGNASVIIYDLNGRKIREYSANNELEVNVDFPAGTYVVKIVSESESVVRKMIVK